MFGAKFKTWMENHIVRPKRKSQHDKEKVAQSGGKGPILESSESLAQSDTGVSSGSQQVLSSSNTDNNEGYCTTTMESNRSGMAHCHTAVNLSSPESAYSTGYSTDGTSPGGAGPPEYYINIRTGKHYFPSPAPTPTSPQPSTAFSQLQPPASISTSFPTVGAALSPCSPQTSSPLQPGTASAAMMPHYVGSQDVKSSSGFSSSLAPFPCDSKCVNVSGDRRNDVSSSVSGNFEVFNFSKPHVGKVPPKSPLSTLKSFLKSPKQDKVKPKPDDSAALSLQYKKKPTSPAKNKKWYKQPFQKFGHRRTDSVDGSAPKDELKKDVQFERNIFLLTKDNTSSPRQRNRIRTNPWLPTEPLSSQNFHNLQINFSPDLVRNRSCTNTPLQNRKTDEADGVRCRLKEMTVRDSRERPSVLEGAINRHVSQKLLEISDHSEEDVTLNEMMGTYNESYVYEKETDILSDSDPTDCEDYISDSEADNGGDEQDSHDDELDFIDNSSIVEGESFRKNTGKCTYHDVYAKKNNFLGKTCRNHSRNESDSRKSLKKHLEAKRKRLKEDKRKRSFRRSLRNPEPAIPEVKDPPKTEPGKVMNMSKLIMQRAEGRAGSRSADGTPVCVRRRQLMEELRGVQADACKRGDGRKGSPLVEDAEADKKYKELIREAENMFVRMQNSPLVQARRRIADANKEADSPNAWKKTEMRLTELPETVRKPDVTPRRNLGLSLAVDSKRPKEGFGFGPKNSFKAKSSAHSPLDPLGPTFRNFTIFKETEKKISSSSEDSESGKEPAPERSSDVGWAAPREATTPTVVPIAFQSVDLGKPLTSYCPQSEPVKRKIYSCSKTYDKLLKRFENESNAVQQDGRTRHSSAGSKKRSDSLRHVPQRGDRCLSKDRNAPHQERTGNLFCNPVYSPYSGPPGNQKEVPLGNACRRLMYDVDSIR